VNEAEVVRVLTDLPDVAVLTAGPDNGAPEVAWGDSFFYYEPDGPTDRKFPFATLVIKDYPGFDTASKLDRPGVFRVNLSVGRARFTELFGFPPEDFPAHQDAYDFTALDRVVPHPVYAKQGWVSILVPGEATREQLSALVAHARQRAVDRYKPPRQTGTESQADGSS
jgi:hypothetical protein